MRAGRAVIALLQAAISPSLAHAQTEYETPEAVAEAVPRADSLRDWRMLIALAHPQALLDFRRDELRDFQLGRDFPPEFRGMDSCMRRTIETWHRFLLDSVYHVPGVDSLSRLSPDSRSMRFRPQRDPRPATLADPAVEADRTIILGHVIADDSTAYVVIEERYGKRLLPDWPARDAQVMTLLRYHGEWRSMLDGNLDLGGRGVAMTNDECP